MSARAALDEWGVVPSLRGLGVGYLSAPVHGPVDLAPEAVLDALARAKDPRLRQAIIALLLVHPELGPAVPRLANELEGPARETLVHYYLAALYLQRLWRTRLRLLLGDQPELPPHWVDERGLPPPDEQFGKAGLRALAADERRRLRVPYEYFGMYGKTAALLLEQLEIDRRAAARR